ncbi:hypothetical protein D3C77_579880 [compost metagenome]
MPSPRLALVLASPCLRRAKKPVFSSPWRAATGSATGSGLGSPPAAPSGSSALGSAGSASCGASTGASSGASTGKATAASGSMRGPTAASACSDCGSVGASSLGFLRNQPNRPFFSPDSTGGFLSSLEPNMGTNISRGRHATAPRLYRTRSTRAFSGAGPTDVAAVNSVEYPSISPPAGVKTTRAARKVPL